MGQTFEFPFHVSSRRTAIHAAPRAAYDPSRSLQISPASTFRINTCKTVSKQTTLTSFGMNTYGKTGGGGGYCYQWVVRIADHPLSTHR